MMLLRRSAQAIRRLLTVVLVLATTASFATAVPDPDAGPLLYAGFAFAGDYSARDKLYPLSASIAAEHDGHLIDDLLQQRLARRPELSRRLSMKLGDDGASINSVALALVQESVETQRVDGKYWVIVTLQANVLAFNQRSGTVVASYPLRHRSTSVQDHTPTPAEMRALVLQAFTNPNPNENLLDQWLDRLERVRIKEGAQKRLQVTEIRFEPEAQRVIEQGGQDVSALKSQMAKLLESSITEQAGIPLIPNSVGEAIGTKLRLRFANSSELNLALPTPDFGIEFVVRDFVSMRLDKTTYVQDIYRVKGTVLLKLIGVKDILNENIYDTHIVTMPKRADMAVSNWDQYAKTLQSLIASLGKQLLLVDDAWLAEHASRNLEARKGFQNANLVIQDFK